jgi:lipid-binding SYLF domain-containing protein
MGPLFERAAAGDEGITLTLTTTTLNSDVFAFIFDRKGLMAGIGLQGSKITKIKK